MKPDSYWLDTAPPFTGAAAGPVEGHCDVAVIGGGFTGLTAALTLTRLGTSVRLLEAGQVASEASGRNGGHCNSGLAHDFSATAAAHGLERAREMYRAFDAGVDRVEAIVREEAIDCHFVRSGKLKLAARPGHFDSMRRAQEVLAREVDDDTAIIEPGDLGTEVGTQAYHGGLLYRRSAMLHVGKFGKGLAAAAVRAGAVIHEHAPVTAIDEVAGGYRLVTAKGTITAEKVILATGASQVGPLGWFRRRIVPVGSFIIVTEPLGAERAQALLRERRTYVTVANIHHYFRLTEDHRLVLGGRARFAVSSPVSDAKSGDVLKAGLLAMFPQLQGVRIDYCWGGLVDMTQDRLPHAGEREGLFFSTGYSGHGTQMSVLMGQRMAAVMAGEAGANPWQGRDWPAIPGHVGPPWFLPAVGLYYQLKDRLGWA